MSTASSTKIASRAGRSVVDFSTEEELRVALEEFTMSDKAAQSCKADWLLPVPDPEAEKQTVDGELKRLLTLKSYLMLDADQEEAFDQLTAEACKVFNVPIALVTLVDLGRQFLFSKQGLPADVKETSRSAAFCAYTILNKKNILIVKDARMDTRFKENALVTGPPYLRFYAGAALVSPEGYRLGTFCVEGPEARPEGLTEEEQAKLKDFATRTLSLMVERRKNLEQRLSASPVNEKLRRHAGVCTNLGSILYLNGECVTAMMLFQESVQTLMYVEEDQNGGLPSEERQDQMAHLLALLSAESNTPESRKAFMPSVMKMFEHVAGSGGSGAISTQDICRNCNVDGIPGLFNPTSNLKGSTTRNHLGSLVFAEPFQISFEDNADKKHNASELHQFRITLDQCSKATLFNMGLVHYHWGSADTAMQFFDLAASLSNKHLDPLAFDPVVLGCLNNMAQIHLHYGRPNDAMEMLSDALVRGNAALAALYDDSKPESSSPRSESSPVEVARTRRLRRKLARTVMNMGHVHFCNCEYDAAMAACKDAVRLLHTNMEDVEITAVWYNIGLLHHHQGDRQQALKYLDKFLDRARVLAGPSHLYVAEALHRQGMILFESGKLYECMKPLNEALRIRRMEHGTNDLAIVESLSLIGNVLQQREEYDVAVQVLQESIAIQRKLAGESDLPFEAAQTLLDLGKSYHAQGSLRESLDAYEEVRTLTRKFFGARHAFVARINIILGNLYLETSESKNTDTALDLFREAMEIHTEQGIPMDLDVVNDPLLRVQLSRTPVASTA